ARPGPRVPRTGGVPLPEPVPAGGGGSRVPGGEGAPHHPGARGGLRGPPAGTREPRQGRQADPLSRPPGLRRAARHRHLLPRLPGEVARHPRRPRAYGRGAGARGVRDRAVACGSWRV
ncbi:MAG: Uncharacterized protein YneG, partial [uncultured Gemmatimonadetes bacterium]